jgi:hypothetical protein
MEPTYGALIAYLRWNKDESADLDLDTTMLVDEFLDWWDSEGRDECIADGIIEES